MSCRAKHEDGDLCDQPTRMRYPGNEPDNGPARQYCPEGHSTCYHCGRWFQCITTTPAWTDPDTFQVIPESKHESDWCPECEDAHRKTHCGCGVSAEDHALHTHTVSGPEPGDEFSWLCCGNFMCCEDGER